MEFLDKLKDSPDGVYKDIVPGVVFTKCGTLIQGNYSRDVVFEGAWPDEVCNWRGHIYDTSQGRLVARPFEKFFNLGENEKISYAVLEQIIKDNPGAKFTYWEKVDGTMIIAYWFEGEIHVATRGSLKPIVDSCYPNYHFAAMSMILTKYPGVITALREMPFTTLVFELVWAKGRENLVTKYKEDDLYLIGMLDEKFDYSSREIKSCAEAFKLKIPEIYDFNDFAGCVLTAEFTCDERISEGYVVAIELGQKVLKRVKIKTQQYRDIKRLMHGVNSKDLLDKILDGTIYEFLGKTPKELQVRVVDYLEKYAYILSKSFEYYKPLSHIQVQKDFALEVLGKVPKPFQKYMFALRNGRGINAVIKPDDIET